MSIDERNWIPQDDYLQTFKWDDNKYYFCWIVITCYKEGSSLRGPHQQWRMGYWIREEIDTRGDTLKFTVWDKIDDMQYRLIIRDNNLLWKKGMKFNPNE